MYNYCTLVRLCYISRINYQKLYLILPSIFSYMHVCVTFFKDFLPVKKTDLNILNDFDVIVEYEW